MTEALSPARQKSKVVTHRSQILDEIVSSEETYVKEVRTLVKVFLVPLKKWIEKENERLPFGDSDMSRIFSNVEQLLAFNEQFLSALQEEYNNQRRLGTVFKERAGYFKMYSTYINNYDSAMQRLAVCDTHLEFRAFVRACELQEACHGLDLRSYLIQPVQRVPRYKLLLTELLKHTRDTHPDWSNLSAALTEISKAALRLNENARDHGRRQGVLEVQEQFKESFVTASRFLVKQGPLKKVCYNGPRKYQFVIFNDMLLYGTETLRGMLMDKKKKYKAHKKVPLEEIMILDYESPTNFVIVCLNSKSFVAVADTESAKNEWIAAFNECFAALKDLGINRRLSYGRGIGGMFHEGRALSADDGASQWVSSPPRGIGRRKSSSMASKNTDEDLLDRDDPCRVQVWVQGESGRPEMHEISLQGLGLPSENDVPFGVFQIPSEAFSIDEVSLPDSPDSGSNIRATDHLNGGAPVIVHRRASTVAAGAHNDMRDLDWNSSRLPARDSLQLPSSRKHMGEGQGGGSDDDEVDGEARHSKRKSWKGLASRHGDFQKLRALFEKSESETSNSPKSHGRSSTSASPPKFHLRGRSYSPPPSSVALATADDATLEPLGGLQSHAPIGATYESADDSSASDVSVEMIFRDGQPIPVEVVVVREVPEGEPTCQQAATAIEPGPRAAAQERQRKRRDNQKMASPPFLDSATLGSEFSLSLEGTAYAPAPTPISVPSDARTSSAEEPVPAPPPPKLNAFVRSNSPQKVMAFFSDLGSRINRGGKAAASSQSMEAKKGEDESFEKRSKHQSMAIRSSQNPMHSADSEKELTGAGDAGEAPSSEGRQGSEDIQGQRPSSLSHRRVTIGSAQGESVKNELAAGDAEGAIYRRSRSASPGVRQRRPSLTDLPRALGSKVANMGPDISPIKQASKGFFASGKSKAAAFGRKSTSTSPPAPSRRTKAQRMQRWDRVTLPLPSVSINETEKVGWANVELVDVASRVVVKFEGSWEGLQAGDILLEVEGQRVMGASHGWHLLEGARRKCTEGGPQAHATFLRYPLMQPATLQHAA